MPHSRLSLIAAVSENRVIGANNTLPWHLPDDLKRFRSLTTGHAVIMGRRNYESIGKPLPQRKNIVLTRDPHYHASGCIVVHSLTDALAAAGDDPEVFIIGGAELYRQTLGMADRIYLTRVHAHVSGDTFFPEFDAMEWRETSREDRPPDDRHPHPYSFLTLDRIRA
jgi:dihydrofolate reductase